jgi:hypothetical protein
MQNIPRGGTRCHSCNMWVRRIMAASCPPPCTRTAYHHGCLLATEEPAPCVGCNRKIHPRGGILCALLKVIIVYVFVFIQAAITMSMPMLMWIGEMFLYSKIDVLDREMYYTMDAKGEEQETPLHKHMFAVGMLGALGYMIVYMAMFLMVMIIDGTEIWPYEALTLPSRRPPAISTQDTQERCSLSLWVLGIQIFIFIGGNIVFSFYLMVRAVQQHHPVLTVYICFSVSYIMMLLGVIIIIFMSWACKCWTSCLEDATTAPQDQYQDQAAAAPTSNDV